MIRPQRRRPRHLLVQVTDAQYAQLKAMAMAARVPMALYIRKVLFADRQPVVTRWSPPARSAADRTPPPP